MALPPSSSPSVRWFTFTTFAEALGDQMARTLAPILAVSLLGAGTAAVGLLHSLGLGMFLLLSIPLGLLGDRLSLPTAMMATSTVLRMTVIACGVLIWALGGLEGTTGIGILLGIMLVIGIADVVYTTGRSILVPRLVPADQIRPTMGRVQTAAQIGTVLAPVALTALLALAAPPLAWVGAALAYLASALTQGRLREHDRAAGPTSASRYARRPSRFRDGICHLLAEPTLRRVTASSALYNAAVMAANTLLPVIALTELHLSPAVFTGIGSLGAVAGIIGAAAASRITARYGLRAVRISAALTTGTGVLLILLMTTDSAPLPGPVAIWIGIFYALSGLCTSVSAVAGADLIARLCPPEMLGAVAGAQRTATMGIMPVSALLIGLLGTLLGTTIATSVWLVLALAAAIPCFRLQEK
ncbi:MAG: MFS transporter [Brachybacterium sp.]|nr:MFS transporter [Brachybacterium sp.]MDN5900927.1 MFS transporter [Brachybacterium sp.]